MESFWWTMTHLNLNSVFFQSNKRKGAKIIYNTSLPVIFGVKHYADALWKLVEKRDIKVNLRTNLVEVVPDKNLAVFENLDSGERTNVEVWLQESPYYLLHPY